MSSHRHMLQEWLRKKDIHVSDQDNLFDNGLDSLNLVRLVLSLERSLGIKLAGKDFNKSTYASVQSIEEHLLRLGGQA